MFIEIANDIIYAACDKDSKHHKEAILLLQKASLAARYGKHIIFVPLLQDRSFDLSVLKKHILKGQIAVLKNITCAIEKRLKNRIKTYMVISFNDAAKDTVHNIIHYDPSKLDTFEIHEETHVIVENIDDAEFYKIIAQYIIGKEFPLNFLSRQGGGVTINTVAQQELNHNCHLCVAIADSDKKYPGDKIGQTAKNLDALKSKSQYLEIYILDKVCEIENLIPYKVLEVFSNETQKKLLNKDLSFYDLKCGLKFKELQFSEKNEYWKSIFGPDLNIPDAEVVNDKNKDDSLPGFIGYGSDILSKVIAFSKANSKKKNNGRSNGYDSKILAISKADRDKINEIHNPSKLSSAQKEEWEKIGHLIFDWTCANKPIRL